MAEDPKGGTTTEQGGEAKATGTAQGAGANAETEAQELARLRAAHAQSLAEKTGNEQTKAELDAARERIAQLEASGTPPTPAPSANPFDSLAAEIGQYQQIIAGDPTNLVAQRLLRQAEGDYRSLQWQGVVQRESPKLEKAPEQFKAKAKELFGTGRYLTAEDAILAARGAVLSDDEIEKARRKAADDAAAALAVKKPDTGGGSGTETAGTTRRRQMTGSEFAQRVKEKTPEAFALRSELDGGKLEVDWTR